ncbi:hypothetical protein [Streptomyces sp. NBC_01353]|uniref:hypothetical protein n=1 Tax=Streptomyces sp. NBC_01353 TaxID=2903835 RepID=UPI002E3238D4|nr:hypothetical protein [Streptomyces sp. NBC_01353]
MPFFRTRKPKPAAPEPSREQLVVGMTTFLSDLLAGDRLAVDMAGPQGEMPMDAAEWAAYPANPERVDRLAHFGGPSPLNLPDTARSA